LSATPEQFDTGLGMVVEMLADRPDRFRLATHTGDVPYAFANLAALVALALVADAERLVRGTWWE